ncbi:glycosyl hydrolase [Halobacteriales archaeon QS_8_65_32]|nr:MAG: glycosyl hydrolase [Halobacteriales archaeon QS_8_65_32]
MALVIGTRDGVFRLATAESATNAMAGDAVLEDAEAVLDGYNTLRVRTLADHGTFAATIGGLFRSTDDGRTWTRLDVPREEVFSIVASPNGERLYAGTHPAHLYVSTDRGETWKDLEGFQDLPSREEWYTPRHRNEAHIRSLGVHPDEPDRVVAGVEVGGVHVSENGGETWTERRDGLHDDVHHVLVRDSEAYVASCGGGLYSTADAGRSWIRLDTEVDHRYFREAFCHGGRLYAAAARGSPGTWRGESGADAAIFESKNGGETLESVPYPGSPEEFVLAWTELDGRVLAGTNGGRLLVRRDEGSEDNGDGDDGGDSNSDADDSDESAWETIGEVPAAIRSLAGTAASDRPT